MRGKVSEFRFASSTLLAGVGVMIAAPANAQIAQELGNTYPGTTRGFLAAPFTQQARASCYDQHSDFRDDHNRANAWGASLSIQQELRSSAPDLRRHGGLHVLISSRLVPHALNRESI